MKERCDSRKIRYIRPIILFNYFLPRIPKPEKEWCSYEIFIHVTLQNLNILIYLYLKHIILSLLLFFIF